MGVALGSEQWLASNGRSEGSSGACISLAAGKSWFWGLLNAIFSILTQFLARGAPEISVKIFFENYGSIDLEQFYILDT